MKFYFTVVILTTVLNTVEHGDCLTIYFEYMEKYTIIKNGATIDQRTA